MNSEPEHQHKVRRFVRSPVLGLVVGIIALAFAMGALQVLRSNAEVADVRRELAAARADLAVEQERSACLRELQADMYRADVNNAIAFNRFVIGLSTRGDVPALTVALEQSGAALLVAFEAYAAQTGC